MSIYLYICEPDQPFSAVHSQFPIDLLELTISQREGHAAIAGLVLPATQQIPDHGWAFIGTDDRGYLEPLLKGQFIGLPRKIDSLTKYVELVATPVNLSAKLDALIVPLKEKHKDCLILRSNKDSQPGDYLEFEHKLFCYDRMSHEITLSSIFQGTKHQTYAQQILEDSLHFAITDTPLRGIHLSLVCEWVQELRGEINLLPKIELLFPQGRINTLTPKGLLATWPQTGQVLGRSGYAVVRSSLKEFAPLMTGVLGHYPTVTPLIHGKQYKNFWFQAELILEWKYTQKRREHLNVVVYHKNQYLPHSSRPLRRISLKLGTLPSNIQQQSYFFDSEVGCKVAKKALQIAQCHLAYSARAAEVKFQVPFIDALDLTLDHQITIEHPSLPNGKVCGKLLNYCLERRFDRAVAHLTVAIATGENEIITPPLEWQYREQPQGIDEKNILNPNYFIETIHVSNHASDQIEWLQSQDGPSSVLPFEQATQINFTLKDLRSSDVLERNLQLKDMYWSAPNQLKSEEEKL